MYLLNNVISFWSYFVLSVTLRSLWWVALNVKGTLMQIWKSANIFVFRWKWYVEDFTVKHLLLFEICSREICGKFVYKHADTMNMLKICQVFKKFANFMFK